MATLPRLRSLRCSRLSPGVNATMNRSDSSTAPTRSVLPLTRRLRSEVVGLASSGRGLPRSRTSLFHPSRRQPRDGFLCRASLSSASSPTRTAESRSLSFRARFWLGPFTPFLTEDGCLCLREHKHAQVLPAGFQPARYVRREAHRSVPTDTGNSDGGRFCHCCFRRLAKLTDPAIKSALVSRVSGRRGKRDCSEADSPGLDAGPATRVWSGTLGWSRRVILR